MNSIDRSDYHSRPKDSNLTLILTREACLVAALHWLYFSRETRLIIPTKGSWLRPKRYERRISCTNPTNHQTWKTKDKTEKESGRFRKRTWWTKDSRGCPESPLRRVHGTSNKTGGWAVCKSEEAVWRRASPCSAEVSNSDLYILIFVFPWE